MMAARIFRPLAAALAIFLASGPASRAAPLLLSATFSAPLPTAMARAPLPSGIKRQVQTILDLWPGPSVRGRRAGSYRLVADQDRLMALTIRLDGKEYRFYRDSRGGRDRWVDGSGQILGAQPLLRPVAGGRMTSPFGWRIHPVLGDWRFHNGVDFALPEGSPVFAAQDGVITQMGWHGNYGKLVRVRHDDGRTNSVYAHLDGFAKAVKVGSRVKRGQKIATVGRSGLATGPHLYWEVNRNDEFIDPLPLLHPPPPLSSREMQHLRKVVARMEETAHQKPRSSGKHT